MCRQWWKLVMTEKRGSKMIEIKITLITSSWGERRWKGGGASGEQVTNPEQ